VRYRAATLEKVVVVVVVVVVVIILLSTYQPYTPAASLAPLAGRQCITAPDSSAHCNTMLGWRVVGVDLRC
jgi:hypothetical protein